MDTDTDGKNVPNPGRMRKVGEGLLKVLTIFVILEPIWMLLPFAGFLYGSVLHIQSLNKNADTAWLTHFVFPVLTLGLTGPIMVISGFLLFLVGAGQIYWAKFRRSGLVSNGIYRFVRHPQYISLTLFGVGILLTWGRVITFISFFVMMFLYFFLTRSEERTCIRLFGDAYRKYREKTSFIFPGDKALRPLQNKLPGRNLPAPVRIIGAFIFTMLICFSLIWLIQSIKQRSQNIPHLVSTVSLGEPGEPASTENMVTGIANGIAFVQAGRLTVIRGPYRNAWAVGFAERLLKRICESETLADYLKFLDEPGEDIAIVWCGPYEKPPEGSGPGSMAGDSEDGRGPAPDPHGSDSGRIVIMRCTLSPGATVADALKDKSRRKIVKGCVALINLGLPEGKDIVEADGKTRGPGFPGEERWDFFLGQFAMADDMDERKDPGLTVPGVFSTAQLVMAKAPILRTRIDSDFAREILDRLAASKNFADQLRKSGAGGDVVAVAFPRPGPNWYKAHHTQPQISLFVILARLTGGKEVPLQEVFNMNKRTLLGAFIIPMDFSIPASEESVGEPSVIGPQRDLEERWRFFLSGVGSGVTIHRH